MARGAIKGITVEIDGNTTKLQQALKGVNSTLNTTQSGLKDVNKLLKMDPGNAELLNQKQKLLAQSIEATTEKLRTLRTASEQAAASHKNYDAWNQAMKPLREEVTQTSEKLRKLQEDAALAKRELGEGKISQAQYDAIQKEIQETDEKLKALRAEERRVSEEFGNPISDAQYDALQREIIETEQSLQRLERQAREAASVLGSQWQAAGEKIQAAGQKVSQVGQTLSTHVTLPMVALGTAAVKVTADFDEAMSRVRALTGATGEEFEALRQKARDLGATTKYSATEAAEAMTYMAMAGWNTEQMLSGIDGVLNLAAASGEELADVSDIVTDALTAFGLKAEDAGHFADVLAAASSSANTNVAMMGETFQYAAPLAGTLGFSIEDVATAIGLMANSGIKASTAGTQLRRIFSNLTGDVKVCGDAIGEVVIKATNSDGSMRALSEILADLRTAFQGLSESEQAAAAKSLVGQNAMSGFLALMNAGEDDVTALTAAIEGCDGAAQDMAETMQDNLTGQVTKLKSAAQELGIGLGDLLVPKAQQLVSVAGHVVDTLNGLDEGTKNLVVNAGLAAAAAGPVLTVGGKLIEGAGNLAVGIGRLVSNTAGYVSAAGGMKTMLATMATQAGLAAIPVAALAAVIANLVWEQTRWNNLGKIDLTGSAVQDLQEASRNYQAKKEAYEAAKADYDATGGLGAAAADEAKNMQEASVAMGNAKAQWDELRKSEEAQAAVLAGVRDGTIGFMEAVNLLGISAEGLQRRLSDLDLQDMADGAFSAADGAEDLAEQLEAEAEAAEEAAKAAKELDKSYADIGNAVYDALNSGEDLMETYQDLEAQLESLDETENERLKTLVEEAMATLELAATMEQLEGQAGSYMAVANAAGYSTQVMAQYLIDNGISVEDWAAKVASATDGVVNDFGKLDTSLDMTLEEMKANFAKNIEAYHNWNNNIDTLMKAAIASGDQRQVAFVQQIQSMGIGAADQVQMMMSDVEGNLKAFAPLMGGAIAEGMVSVYNGIESEGATVSDAAGTAMEDAAGAAEDATGWSEAGSGAMDEVAGGIDGAAGQVSDAAKSAGEGGVTAAGGVTGWNSVGSNYAQGIANGITSNTGAIRSAAIGAAKAALAAAKASLAIKSPSRVARDQIGLMYSEGVAEGILKGVPEIASASNDAARACLTPAPESGMESWGASLLQSSGSAAAGNAEVLSLLKTWLPQLANMQMVLDSGQTVGALAPGMDRALGTRQTSSRRGLA